jgi:hypothetical protein
VKRWSSQESREVERPAVDAFLAEIVAVCTKHGLWLSHEDAHGGFIVTDENTKDWLEAASVDPRP